jgi:hypothetical protein
MACLRSYGVDGPGPGDAGRAVDPDRADLLGEFEPVRLLVDREHPGGPLIWALGAAISRIRLVPRHFGQAGVDSTSPHLPSRRENSRPGAHDHGPPDVYRSWLPPNRPALETT